jgi:hypothetical protein
MAWHGLASHARLIRRLARLTHILTAEHPRQTATGSTSIVPPQLVQRDNRAGAVAPSLDLPQAMQYTRNNVRATLRAAARCSAEGSSIDSNAARNHLRDRVSVSFVADSAIMRQSSRPMDGGTLPAIAGGVSCDNSTRIGFPESFKQQVRTKRDLHRAVLAFCEGAVSQAGTVRSIRAALGPWRDM